MSDQQLAKDLEQIKGMLSAIMDNLGLSEGSQPTKQALPMTSFETRKQAALARKLKARQHK